MGFVRMARIGVQVDGIAQESGIHTKALKVLEEQCENAAF